MEVGQEDGPRRQALSVSAAMAAAKGALEGLSLRIVGEVSELSNKAGYKAVYFTIKDEKAALPCMMWNNRYAACGVSLQIGAVVEVTGRFTLYAAKGRMNFDVSAVHLAGEGSLRLKVAEIAKRLQAEGLMAPERKRALPPFPQTIGLVTSPRGAAVHDVLRTLRRRFPLARVLVAGVPVEGAGAPAALASGLRCVADAGAQVILLVRGGGSFEDLMPFNDEGLARAVAASPVPVVTGIGHEPDTSIADMVADLRASTPTAAAEAVSASVVEVASSIAACGRRMGAAFASRLNAAKAQVALMAARPLFAESTRLFEGESQWMDDMAYRLTSALPAQMRARREALYRARVAMASMLPHLTAPHAAALSREEGRLDRAAKAALERAGAQLSLQAARLEDLSPLAVIARGYAMAQTEGGAVVSSVSQVEYGERLQVSVSDGIIACDVVSAQNVDISLEIMEAEDGR